MIAWGGLNIDASKIAKIIANTVYLLGTLVFAILICLFIFGADYVPFPDAMLPSSMREIAFIWLAIGTTPMLLSCIAVYRFNNIKESEHTKRILILIFLPAFLCGICLLVVLALIAMMMFQGFVHILRISQ